jgi:hypothetical protein
MDERDRVREIAEELCHRVDVTVYEWLLLLKAMMKAILESVKVIEAEVRRKELN